MEERCLFLFKRTGAILVGIVFTTYAKSKGFTLIELLVVIAVIGILASVVLAALGNGRNKSANASVKANMRTVSQQIEINYLKNNNSYGSATFAVGTCAQTANTPFADATVWAALQEAKNRNGGTTGTCASTSAAWAVSIPLKISEGGNGYWCVDSQGGARTVAASITTTSCP